MSDNSVDQNPQNVNHRKLTPLQRELLRKIADKHAQSRWYLDQNRREWRALNRLEIRGLVDFMNEGEGLWRCYWDITPDGLKAVQS